MNENILNTLDLQYEKKKIEKNMLLHEDYYLSLGKKIKTTK